MSGKGTAFDYPAGDGRTVCRGAFYAPPGARGPLPVVRSK